MVDISAQTTNFIENNYNLLTNSQQQQPQQFVAQHQQTENNNYYSNTAKFDTTETKTSNFHYLQSIIATDDVSDNNWKLTNCVEWEQENSQFLEF